MSQQITFPPDSSLLDDGSKLGGWWHKSDVQDRIVCDLCPRDCSLKPGDRGFCFVRENRDGKMVLNTYGKSTGFCIDPIEKKPLNHFFPGTSVLSFGTAGCNLGCKFCQNWSISKSREVQRLSEHASPAAIATAARQLGCKSVAFTYNDPVIWAEYAMDVADQCHEAKINTVAVTAGYITDLARRPFFQKMDAANVDLKAFTEQFYHRLTLSHLQPVLDTLIWLKNESDVWFEITNLVIPNANDGDDEFQRMCDWLLRNLGDSVPIHFTAFHPDFRMKDRQHTPVETLLRAWDVAKQSGIKHVYVGNVSDETHQNTYCPNCGQLLIQRNWYQLGSYNLDGDRCRFCSERIPGRFRELPGDWGRKRLPVRISDFQLKQRESLERHDMKMSSASETTADVHGQLASPNLTEVQKRSILEGVSELITEAVFGYRSELSDPSLSGAANTSVLGCFVTIKRQGRLRGCCGFLGRTSGIRDAIIESAVASATRDVRMPSVSAAELEYLDLSVSLLHSPRELTSTGAERVKEVRVGQHGLQITRGKHRGLLLPVVATENGFDAAQFLQQVCLKANLPPTAWKEPDTQLFTFESESFGGPIDTSVVRRMSVSKKPLLTDEELRELADACRRNIVALIHGATPSYYLPNCKDGTVNAITLTASVPSLEESPRFSQFSIRPGLPLQATLFDLAKLCAGVLTSNPTIGQQLDSATVDLMVLHDPAMHGTVAQPDMKGFDPQRRAIIVTEDEKSAWCFDPHRSAEEQLDQSAREANVRMPNRASVLSMEAMSTSTPVLVANVPRPRPGTKERAPAVAGMFYPDGADALFQLVDQLLADAPRERSPWAAAMVPHAGLQYSGRIAAKVFQRIEIPKTVIVIGPKHTRLGVDCAVAPHEQWILPGTSVPSDLELAKQLADSIPQLQLDSAAHSKEHAIEVELPLLARLAPKSRVVGIAIGPGDYEQCRRIATGLTNVIGPRMDETLLVISTDMNHFATDEENRRLDEMALKTLDQLDSKNLFDTVRKNHISMCGVLPAVIVLETLKQLGKLKTSRRVAYGTSADVSGDKSRVVGYAGMLFD